MNLRKKFIFAVTGSLFLVACNTMKSFNDEIKQAGYIPYSTPLQYAGPGTLIGGRPSKLNLIANPSTCFPTEIDGVPTNLLKIDYTTLPTKERTVTTSGKANVDLLNTFGTGNPLFKIGAKFNSVKTMTLTMKGIHVEYLDSVLLSGFYHNQMSEICKDFLDKVGFIIQAMKVDELEFTLYDRKGGKIDFSLNNLNQYIDIAAGVEFIVENKTTLKITTPKYIGYQLGRLIKEDKGLSLYRASTVKMDKYNFVSLVLFEDKQEYARDEVNPAYPMQENSQSEFKSLSPRDLIDNNAKYKY